jgi:hypothetical protein
MQSRPANGFAGIALTSLIGFGCLSSQASAQEELEVIGRLSNDLGAWLSNSFARTPSLLLGLALIGAVPILSIFGSILSRHLRKRERLLDEGGGHAHAWAIGNPHEDPMPADPEPTWPARAWLEFEAAPGHPGLRHVISNPIVRVGRDVENDVCVRNQTVSRFHAAFYRSEDAEYFIRDLSGNIGAGIRVNGVRKDMVRLASGDSIELGTQRIVFFAEKPDDYGSTSANCKL